MAEKWIDIFALSQFGGGRARLPYGGRTVRIVIRNYIEGNMIRLTLGNRYGRKEVAIQRVTAANCDESGILLEQPVTLTFNGEEYAMLNPKSSLTSDDMDYKVNKGHIAVSIYFSGKASLSSFNMLREKVIVTSKGDYTTSECIEDANRMTDRILNKAFKLAGVPRCDIIPALESVSVFSNHNRSTVIAFGDSITQGGKWTYELSERMNNPVLNLGISGNRLLRDSKFPIISGLFGEAAIKRFDRDVLTRQGAGVVIVLLGTNDIGQPGTFTASKGEMVVAEEIIEGLTDIATRAKKAGLYTFVCTHTPFKYFRMGYIGDSMQVRNEVNQWIRNNKVYYGYYDFDAMIRDDKDNEMIAPPYDSGDHLHPSDLGSIKMLESIDIDRLIKLVDGN